MTADRTDVLVVGAGISAMAAAIELVKAGRSVRLVELNDRSRYGGQCREAFGGIFFVDSPEQKRVGATDDAEKAWADWQSYAEFEPGTERQQWWARHYIERCVPDVRDWLVGMGVHFFPMANWAEKAHDGRGNRVPRFHLAWGCGPRIVDRVAAVLAPHEGRLLHLDFGQDVREIVTEGGQVVGVRAASTETGAEQVFRADHVVIAAGGFTGNLDMVRRHWPTDEWGRPPAELLCGVWPETDGRMHAEAERLGGAVANASNMWVYAAGVTDWQGDYPGHGAATIPMKSALWMGSDGRRFDPPVLAGADTRAAVARIAAQEHPWSWALANTKILVRELTIQGSKFNEAFRERHWGQLAREVLGGAPALAEEFLQRCPDVVSAPTLDELGRRMQQLTPDAPIDLDGMRADIAAYDDEITGPGKFYSDDQLLWLRTVKTFLNDKLRTARYEPIAKGHDDLVAVRLRLTARKTLGGVVTDEHCRVLTDDGAPVTGLYAIGETAGFGGGGMHGKRTLEGTLLGGCLLTGRDVGRHLARS